MPRKLAACEQCRASKQACDHLRPVCSRCRENDRAAVCIYRDRPFKKKKGALQRPSNHLVEPGHASQFFTTSTTGPRYPNPGYLGSSSSHVSIYGQLSSGNYIDRMDTGERSTHLSRTSHPFDEVDLSEGAQFIDWVRGAIDVSHCARLLDKWADQGISLALAGQFTNECGRTVKDILGAHSSCLQGFLPISKSLYINSCRSILSDVNTSTEWSDQFCSENARWETLGLFFTAACRATNDVLKYANLYESKEERLSFQRLTMRFSDRCLEIALSLDCMSDLQLMLQYENFIMHAFVDGDQSYHSWRRLGDVISSLFALGYHERTSDNNTIQPFLQDLRRCAFARVYSADKNVSIFLGRPPRLLKRYCRFRLPGDEQQFGEESLTEPFNWKSSHAFDYTTDTRWSAICAMMKEDILDPIQRRKAGERTKESAHVQAQAKAQWLALPPHLRLEGALKSCERRPIERDLLVSMRLNYLHILFLVRSVVLNANSKPDEKLVSVAADMLSLTVETMLLKDELANSGTGLVWRVAYYGLPAAGVICLALLNHTVQSSSSDYSPSKLIQDLSVLVAEVETGTFIYVENPNYALLSGAARIIKSILDRAVTVRGSVEPQDAHNDHFGDQVMALYDERPLAWTSQDLWDFDMNFWNNLADHPFLSGLNDDAANF